LIALAYKDATGGAIKESTRLVQGEVPG